MADICEDRHARLQDGLASVAGKADAIEAAIAEVQRLEAAALQQHTHATAAVGERLSALVASASARAAELLAGLDAERDRSLRPLASQRLTLEAELGRLRAQWEQVQALLPAASAIEIVAAELQTARFLEELRHAPVALTPAAAPHILLAEPTAAELAISG